MVSRAQKSTLYENTLHWKAYLAVWFLTIWAGPISGRSLASAPLLDRRKSIEPHRLVLDKLRLVSISLTKLQSDQRGNVVIVYLHMVLCDVQWVVKIGGRYEYLVGDFPRWRPTATAARAVTRTNSVRVFVPTIDSTNLTRRNSNHNTITGGTRLQHL